MCNKTKVYSSKSVVENDYNIMIAYCDCSLEYSVNVVTFDEFSVSYHL